MLLLGTSGSMGGEPIRQLNEGINTLKMELELDPLAAKRVEVAMVAGKRNKEGIYNFNQYPFGYPGIPAVA